MASGFTNNQHGFAYGFGGIGKIIGPLGLALIVGSSNVVKPDASAAMIVPAFVYLATWYLLAGVVYFFFRHRNERTFDRRDRSRARARTGRATLNISFPVVFSERAKAFEILDEGDGVLSEGRI